MVHDVLGPDVIVKDQGGPRPPKGLEPMDLVRDVPMWQDFL